MPTISIKNTENVPLNKDQFEGWDELINCYYEATDMVLLEHVDEAALPDTVQQELRDSIQQGKKGVVDFRGWKYMNDPTLSNICKNEA